MNRENALALFPRFLITVAKRRRRTQLAKALTQPPPDQNR